VDAAAKHKIIIQNHPAFKLPDGFVILKQSIIFFMAKATTTAPGKNAASKKATAKPTATAAKKTAPARTKSNDSTEEKKSMLEKLFVAMLKDILWAEQHLVEALTKMQEAATTEVLQEAFEDHKYATQKHISRLEKVFSLLGEESTPQKCDAMEGLTKEADAMIEETTEGSMTRDAALIIAAQKVEHYEIATYGSLVQVAVTLGYGQIASILDKTLIEEEETDSLLTEIAESEINPMADEEEAEQEDDNEAEDEMESEEE